MALPGARRKVIAMRRELPYADRVEAGRRLAGHLAHLRGPDLVVVGLPRGGIPVAATGYLRGPRARRA